VPLLPDVGDEAAGSIRGVRFTEVLRSLPHHRPTSIGCSKASEASLASVQKTSIWHGL
jgi:hypothetical protein